jgi:inositol oxygenase
MYSSHCGIQALTMSWGHDEYLYRVLKHNKSTLPEQALWCIRYHSFYPWHTSGDYEHLAVPEDEEIKKWVNIFK